MPELPEVETTRKGIYPHIYQQRVVSVIIRRRDLRWPIPDNMHLLLQGNLLLDIKRRGKYLLMEFESGTALLHLGMSGSIRILGSETIPEKHDHVELHFTNGKLLRFNDPRRFGAFLWAGKEPLKHKLLANLGVEPFDPAFNAKFIYQAGKKRTTAVKQLIMDAKLLVGVGNIYANESLFLAGIHPDRSANRISLKRYERLVSTIKMVLTKAIEQGGTSLQDFTQVDGQPGYFTQALHVYGKAGYPCTNCNTSLSEIRQSGRSSVFCNNCQF
ncbi:MAG: bifunctional DNA-formamidopyrimidine glycosylase/DNA-(apurinic or apyrimidinic site) lyase [Gammaproteobacteria bacterium]|nr:bifunctional DNA-formamidopyrimidine glycosylase/DNA-(apurinic or apyrimidinic site) lyase [Gammaproteobacteria bacterium]